MGLCDIFISDAGIIYHGYVLKGTASLWCLVQKKKKKNAILSTNVGGGAFLHMAREHTLAPADLKETCQGGGACVKGTHPGDFCWELGVRGFWTFSEHDLKETGLGGRRASQNQSQKRPLRGSSPGV